MKNKPNYDKHIDHLFRKLRSLLFDVQQIELSTRHYIFSDKDIQIWTFYMDYLNETPFNKFSEQVLTNGIAKLIKIKTKSRIKKIVKEGPLYNVWKSKH